MDVRAVDDPTAALAAVAGSLVAEPARNNLVLTILQRRADGGQACPAWIVGPEPGLALHADPAQPLALSALSARAAVALADALARDGMRLPAVSGEAVAAAAFAGRWTELHDRAAVVDLGQRLYELGELTAPSGVPGHLRVATVADRPVLASWVREFSLETGHAGADVDATVTWRLATSAFSVWEHAGELRSMAALTPPVAGVARVQAVFTPVHERGQGWAGACVAALSARARADSHRCVLYTDLANRTSNALYRRLGYRAIAECLRYRFL